MLNNKKIDANDMMTAVGEKIMLIEFQKQVGHIIGLNNTNQAQLTQIEPVTNIIAYHQAAVNDSSPPNDLQNIIIQQLNDVDICGELISGCYIFTNIELKNYRLNFVNQKLEYRENEGKPYNIVSEIIVYHSNVRDFNDTHYHRVSFMNNLGKMIECLIPTDVEPQHLCKKLYNKGMKVHLETTARTLCRKYIISCHNIVRNTQIICMEQHNGYLDENTYLFANATLPVFIGEQNNKYYFDTNKLNTRHVLGTLDEWKTNIADYCTGNVMFEFGISMAFAGIILRDLDIKLSSGFHIYSLEAGTGKTTLAKVAATVMGNPNYIVHQWDQTTNNLDLLLAHSNDGFIVLDELKQLRETANLPNIIMKLGNGSGAGRMAQDAKSSREQFTWLTYYLSTGNHTTDYFIEIRRKSEHRKNESSHGATETRLYNIQMIPPINYPDKVSIQQLFKHLNINVDRYCGIAGYTFIEKYLSNHTDNKAKANTLYKEICSEINNKYQDKDVHSRIIDAFAVIEVAGRMAKEFGIIPDKFNPIEAVGEVLHTYIDNRGGNRDHQEYLNTLYTCVVTNRKQFFEYQLDEMSNVIRNHPTTYYGRIEKNIAYIGTPCFAKIFGQDNFKSCKPIRDILRQKGVLVPSENGDSEQHGDRERYVRIDICILKESSS